MSNTQARDYERDAHQWAEQCRKQWSDRKEWEKTKGEEVHQWANQVRAEWKKNMMRAEVDNGDAKVWKDTVRRIEKLIPPESPPEAYESDYYSGSEERIGGADR